MDPFIVIASDGVWDVLVYDEIVNIYTEAVQQTPEIGPNEIAMIICNTAIARGSHDNVSCVVVLFDWHV